MAEKNFKVGIIVDGSLQLKNLTTTPADGYLLKSTDANGNADWVDSASIGGANELNELTDVTTGLPGSPTQADDGKMLFYDFGAGVWITDDTVTHGTVVINAKKSTAGTIAKGTPVYLVGFDADIHTVETANASAAGTMPVIGFAGEQLDNTNSKHVITFGKIQGIDTTSTGSLANGESWAINDDLYVDTTTGELTNVRPTGASTQIQRVAKVLRVDAAGGQLFIFNTARTAGLPNLTQNTAWVGNGSNQPIEANINTLGIYSGSGTIPTTTTATITDNLTFDGGNVIINESGGSTDFKVESNNNDHMLFVDGSADRIGINVSGPSASVDIKGNGATLSTSSLIVQNSANSETMRCYDNKQTVFGGNATQGPRQATVNIRDIPDFQPEDGNDFFTLGLQVRDGGGHLVHKIGVMKPLGGLTSKIGGDLYVEAGSVSQNSSTNTEGGFLYLRAGRSAQDASVLGRSNIYLQTCTSAGPNQRGTWATALQIDNNQNIGIGTPPLSGSRLLIKSPSTVNNTLAVQHSTGTNSILVRENTNGYTAFGDTTNTASGSPTETIDVNGNGRFRIIGSGASAGALHYTSNGTLTTNTSDERLKTNVVPLTDSLKKIKKLQGVSFDWKDKEDTSGTHIGFIAQEVEQVVPEVVFENPADGYKGINYHELVPMLVESIKDQQNQISYLKGEITKLKNQLNNATDA